jgi:hypothetical protein
MARSQIRLLISEDGAKVGRNLPTTKESVESENFVQVCSGLFKTK